MHPTATPTRRRTLPRALVVTPHPSASDLDDPNHFLKRVSAFLEAGALVQLRAKSVDRGQTETTSTHGDAQNLTRTTVPSKFSELARLASLLPGASERLVVNGDPSLAAELNIGVHLNGERLSSLKSRPLSMQPNALVGASCHDGDQLSAAIRVIGCDYVVISPVKQSVSCPTDRPLGWDGFRRLAGVVANELQLQTQSDSDDNVSRGCAVYALGGVGPNDASDAAENGAHGIAAISSFWSASNPTAAVNEVTQFPWP